MDIKDFLPLPDLFSFKHILFVQPHPDDNEIGAGGIIALCHEKGIKLSYLTVSKGKGGSATLSSHELVKIRQNELKEAGKVLGVENFIQLDLKESHYPDEKELVIKIVDVLRQVKADCVITIDPYLKYEAHPTHRKVGQAVLDACLMSSNRHFPLPDQDNHPYPIQAVGFYASAHPNSVIDISSTVDLKYQAIQKHRSQFDEAGFAQLKQYLDYRHFVNGTEKNIRCAETLKLLPLVLTHMMVESETY